MKLKDKYPSYKEGLPAYKVGDKLRLKSYTAAKLYTNLAHT